MNVEIDYSEKIDSQDGNRPECRGDHVIIHVIIQVSALSTVSLFFLERRIKVQLNVRLVTDDFRGNS